MAQTPGKFRLEVDLTNAAFEGELPALQLLRILREVAAELKWGIACGRTPQHRRSLRDINGNTVAIAEFVDLEDGDDE